MVVLRILGVIVLLIALILLIPVGADLGYEAGKLHVSAKVAGVLIRLFPRKKTPDSDTPKPPKKKKEKRAKKPKQESGEQPKERKPLNITLDEILALLKAVVDGFAYFGGRIRVDRFVLHLVVSGGDPYNVAMTYGKLNAWLSALAPACKKLNAKNSDVWTEVDFTQDWPQLEFAIAMSFRLGQIVGMGFRIGFGALKVLLQRRRRIKQEAKAAAQLPPQTDTEKNEQTIQDEERTAANG